MKCNQLSISSIIISCSHTYDPYSIKWHFVMEPLKVVVPPFMCRVIREIRICCQTRPHLDEDKSCVQAKSGDQHRVEQRHERVVTRCVCGEIICYFRIISGSLSPTSCWRSRLMLEQLRLQYQYIFTKCKHGLVFLCQLKICNRVMIITITLITINLV